MSEEEPPALISAFMPFRNSPFSRAITLRSTGGLPAPWSTPSPSQERTPFTEPPTYSIATASLTPATSLTAPPSPHSAAFSLAHLAAPRSSSRRLLSSATMKDYARISLLPVPSTFPTPPLEPQLFQQSHPISL